MLRGPGGDHRLRLGAPLPGPTQYDVFHIADPREIALGADGSHGVAGQCKDGPVVDGAAGGGGELRRALHVLDDGWGTTRRSQTGANPSVSAGWVDASHTDTSTSLPTISSLTNGTSYRVRVRGQRTSGGDRPLGAWHGRGGRASGRPGAAGHAGGRRPVARLAVLLAPPTGASGSAAGSGSTSSEATPPSGARRWHGAPGLSDPSSVGFFFTGRVPMPGSLLPHGRPRRHLRLPGGGVRAGAPGWTR